MPVIDLANPPTPDQIETISRWLGGADYRLIRPLVARESFAVGERPEKLVTVAILDTETTGTDQQADKVIELGMVLVEIAPDTGQAYRVLQVFNQLEDPGMPIPPASTQIHHITDEMVAGKRIDDDEVARLLAPVALVVAHNAGFDRPFVEKRWPVFATKAWACSFQQVPWSDEGISSAKLEFLAYRCGFHFTGHRASIDCQALLEVLQADLPTSGTKAMQALLVNAREAEIRISALGSPFESKDVLRQRGYRWNPDKKVWAKAIRKAVFDEEIAWLSASVYGGRPFQLEQERLTAMNRFSERAGERQLVRYPQ
ncbi:3'-5' exonuclease [Propionivibrio dicarboxylicus]|uniref:DNA polymerase-3 subunit epsilon n=1 Tax=Propionivibrio dicarboxylicus TaxID=83767 RepID=A0A1G7Y3S5_9RHOO|nr:3'-5' exonuclease [Propionivibrio dicarboxylicus]SDG91064.1 DNA polymerase-3 subunit epsilon [Propionivibrio dicarboxylicus]